MRKLFCFFFLLIPFRLWAAECTAVFTNGAATNSPSGKIKIEKNARIFGTSGLLDFGELDDQSGGGSCNTQSCGLSGNLAEALNIPAFKSHSTSNKIKISKNGSGSASAGDYEEITLEQGASFTFSSVNDEYIIKSFKAGKNAVVVMAPGDYWIEEFVLEQGVGVTFSSTGTVRLYANQVTLNKNVLMNVGGGSERLVLVAYDQVKLEQGAGIEGFIYAQTSFKAEKNAVIKGGVNSAEVVLGQGVALTYEQPQIDTAEFEDLCTNDADASVHHYRIEHDDAGLTCEAETMIIKACRNEDCSQVYDQDSNLTIQPFAANVTIPANSTGQSFSVSYTTEGSAGITVVGASPAADNSLVCVDDINVVGTTGKSCSISFANAGFQLFGATVGDDIPNQVAEQKFANVNLRAVKDNNGVCVAALQGNQTVDLSFACSNPASCIIDLDYDLDLNDGFVDQAFSENVQGPLDLVFDNQGIAALDQLVYRDAGRISLAIEGVIDGASITSGNALLNVVPQRLTLSEDEDTTSFDAGDPFDVSVFALGAQNGILQNYQPGALQFKATRVGRTVSGYVDGAFVSSALGQSVPGQLSPAFTATNNPAFSAGTLTFSAYYSEVDTVELDVRDNDYLQEGVEITSGGVITLGPFVPAYFDLEVSNQDDLSFVNTYTSSTPFSYLGRDIALSEDIEIELTARNAQAQVTQNYQTNNPIDDWQWLPVANPPTGVSWSQPGQTISVFDAGTAAAADVSVNNVVQLGKKRLLLRDMTVVYAKPKQEMVVAADALDASNAPFDASATVTLDSALFNDSATPVCYNTNYDTNNDGTKGVCESFSFGPIQGAQLRWGRLVMENVFGPETEDKLVPVRTEYWNGSEFILNRDDSVNTAFLANTLSLDEIHPDNGLVDITDNVTVSNRNIEITAGKSLSFEGIYVTKPDDGSRGSLIIELEPVNDAFITWDDYLQFDWNGTDEAGVGNPSAEVSFGQYRGNDRIIHWREVFN